MTCRKVHQLIPLFAGGDLRPRLMKAVRAHLEACPGCRKEVEAFQADMARLKTAAGAEGVADWSEDEWKALMARVSAEARETRRDEPGRRSPAWRPRWAAASVLGAFLGLAVMSLLFRDRVPPALEEPAAAGPEVVSLTMVSQETGLQVVWFLNKNFDWEGDKE